MILSNWVKNSIEEVKHRIKHSNLDNLVWLVNILPSLLGYSIRNDKINAPFFIVHLSLLLYVYGAGCAMYQIKYAVGAGDFIKSYVNVSLFILIGNITWWWIKKRPILRATLRGIEESDRLAADSSIEDLRKLHKKRLFIIKVIILTFYTSQYFNEFFVYLPHRADVNHDYCMVPCPGIEAKKTPYKQICITILSIQELTITFVVLNYQTLLLLLIAHTSVMFQMLSKELMALNNYSNLDEHKVYVRGKLPLLIRRHNLTLNVFDNLKLLYTAPIGVDFGSNAVCISLFFYMPFQEWLKFMPVLFYCFLVFFLYCFLCQKMTNASERFETAVYSCGWENFDIREQKLIYVMLLQAQKPIVLFAADIIPINIYTFATTLQAMFKFVTVVKF